MTDSNVIKKISDGLLLIIDYESNVYQLVDTKRSSVVEIVFEDMKAIIQEIEEKYLGEKSK